MDTQIFLHRLLLFLTTVMALLFILPASSISGEFEQGLQKLTQRKFGLKIEGLEMIVSSSDVRKKDILLALLDASLFYVKKNKQVVFVQKTDNAYTIVNVLSNAEQKQVSKRKLKKIGINNQIRKKIKGWLALLELYSEDPVRRATAVYSMLDDLTPDILDTFTRQLSTEKDKNVIAAQKTALAMNDLKNGSQSEKLRALAQIKGQLHPAVKTSIMQAITTETDSDIKAVAIQALQGIESQESFYQFCETLFFGLSAGSILVLAAIGLAITFGVIGVINMAHGELIMIGAYTAYVIQQLLPNSIGIGILIAIPAAFIVSGLTGIMIERSIIRFLYGRPLETLLATFGVSLVLQQTVRSIFSPLNRAVSAPDWMSGSLYINPVLSLTMNRIVILLFSLLVFAGLYLIMKKTALGLQVRAVSQNRSMARAMGVKASRVDALTFGLGSGIAGVAGVALSQLTNVGPNLGQAYIIDSFMVVVFGGVGNLWGTLLAGLSLGTANKFIEPFSGAMLSKIIMLVFIILFIQKRPQGLFPQKGRAAG